MTIFQSSTIRPTFAIPTPTPMPVGAIWGLEDDFRAVNGVGLFETEMYVSGMYGSGKTGHYPILE